MKAVHQGTGAITNLAHGAGAARAAGRRPPHSQSRPARERCDHKTAIAAFAKRVLQERDLGAIMAEACRIGADALGAPLLAVLEHRAAEGDLLVRAGVGWDAGAAMRADAHHPAGAACLERRAAAALDLRARPDLPELYARYGIVSAVAVPVASGDAANDAGCFGALIAASPERRRFSPAEVTFLCAVADLLSAAISRAHEGEALRRDSAAHAALAEERQLYLREMQHRVRNDLQQIHSLAIHHGRRAEGAASEAGFEAIGRRVLSLSAFYDHLLGVGMGRQVEFGDYLQALCAKISAAEELSARRIALAVEAAPLPLDIGAAAALGIAVNELVANAAEHAFADGAGGQVRVRLAAEGGARPAALTVADDGSGFSAALPGASHGLRLVHHLVERAGGTLTREVAASGVGTTWKIEL